MSFQDAAADLEDRLEEALAEIARLQATLVESCEEQRAEMWESYGGCERAVKAEAEIKRLRQEVANLLDELSLPCPTCGDTRETALAGKP